MFLHETGPGLVLSVLNLPPCIFSTSDEVRNKGRNNPFVPGIWWRFASMAGVTVAVFTAVVAR